MFVSICDGFFANTHRWALPIVFCRVDKIVDFGVDQLEYSLLRCLFIVAKLFRRIQPQGAARRGGRPCSDQQLLQLTACYLKVLQIDENLHDLAQVLGTETLDERFANLLTEKLIQRLIQSS